MRRSWPTAAYLLLVLAGIALAGLAHDAPLAPGRVRGWLQADALSALTILALGALGLARDPAGRRELPAALAFALATIAGHLGLAAALLAAGGALLAWARRPSPPVVDPPGGAAGSPASAVLRAGRSHGVGPNDPRQTPNGAPVRRSSELGVDFQGAVRLARLLPVAELCAALGLLAVGVAAGEWRYGAPGVGAGLGSGAFALILLGTLVAAGGVDVARGRPPAGSPLAAVACLYVLLRLFSLGPWNLGWLLAALVAGGALALGAAWQAAAAPPAQAGGWMGAYLCGLAVAGAGLGSGAGVILAGFALLVWPIAALGLADAGAPRSVCWSLSGAVPLTGPFVLAWMGVGAAVAGGLTTLAAALWLAALLMAAAVARGGAPGAPLAREPALAAALSAGLGVGAPLAVAGLLAPVAAQLQGGLTPFGDLALWPWAGLLAFDAARQPVATLPSIALAALMLILAALSWVALRLARREA